MLLARLRRLVGLGTALAGLVAIMTTPHALAAGTWTALAPVPLPTEGMYVGSIGNDIIAAYGNSGMDTNLTRIYDIDQNTWGMGSAAPLPIRAEGTAVTHGGNLYALGGREGRFGTVINDNDRYTPATDTWASLASMPTARAGLAAAVKGNAIYVVGGRTQGDGPCIGPTLSTVERYDIDTNTWTTVAPLPSPRSDLAAMAHGGKIYVFGGCSNGGAVNTVEVYNPQTDTWSSRTPMPTARAAFYQVGKVGNRIYVMGGIFGVGVSSNEVYTVPTDSWSTDTPMLTPRDEMGVASHGGRVYTVGGRGASAISSNANEVFKP